MDGHDRTRFEDRSEAKADVHGSALKGADVRPSSRHRRCFSQPKSRYVSRFIALLLRSSIWLLVFGVDLETLLKRESADGEIALGALPSVVLRLIEVVEARGLTEVGICELASVVVRTIR